jgi:Trypsin-like peptidase domain
MMRTEFLAAGLVFVLAVTFAGAGHAVESGSSYLTSAPTSADIPNWGTGWSQPAGETGGSYVTGWSYVGQVNGDGSATYLGDGWVLTVAHVGAGIFDLNGNAYAEIPGSAQSISNSSGTADLTLFRINTTSTTNGSILGLPQLTLSTSDPIAFAFGVSGNGVVMIGYGGGQGESWGFNTVTQINQLITLQGASYVTNDFFTALGTTSYNNPGGSGSQSVTNNAQLVGGDSGGGDFIFNPGTGQWELAGINEAVGTTNQGQYVSAFVQLDTYAAQIEADMSPVPLPASLWPMLLGLGGLAALSLKRKTALQS